MILRPVRVMVAIAVTALSSGIHRVVIAALDDDCCTEACDGFDGKRCPPNCKSVVCARAHVSLGAVVASSVVPQPIRPQAVVVNHATPELPLVVNGLFHPPIA